MTASKIVLNAASGVGGAGLDVDEVFSTHVYTGTGSTLNIVNNIDLAGEGGLVWHKWRGGTSDHGWFDTERGISRKLTSNSSDAQAGSAGNGVGVTAFNSNGYTLGTQYSGENGNGNEVVSWTFRKAPKFFDIQTYTGTGSVQNIAHNLDSVPACIFVKCTSNNGITNEWAVYHTSLGNGKYLYLNADSTQQTGATHWNSTTPTSTQFTVGTSTRVNTSGRTYVAYIFAHNNGDGEFGPDADQDIIKCGSFGGSSGNQEVNLGFEPQYVMMKVSSGNDTGSRGKHWIITDSMRGAASSRGASDGKALRANATNAEQTDQYINFTPTGFQWVNSSEAPTYIYIAIRRGSLFPPEAGTEVFNTYDLTSASLNTLVSTSFPPDMSLHLSNDGNKLTVNRLTGGIHANSSSNSPRRWLQLYGSAAEDTGNYGLYYAFNSTSFKVSNNGHSGQSDSPYAYMWKRAPNYFDVVVYKGNGTAGRTVSHNLGVAPEMIWYKNRSDTSNWIVYHKDIGTDPTTEVLELDTSDAKRTSTAFFNSTAPSASVLTLGTASHTNYNNNNYIAYLFATLDGISKVGSYTGNGSNQTINCGFSSGARWILIKRIDSTGDWYVWDTERGIVAGNEQHTVMNTQTGKGTDDSIDPENSGFIVNQISATNINVSSAEYIFCAIA